MLGMNFRRVSLQVLSKLELSPASRKLANKLSLNKLGKIMNKLSYMAAKMHLKVPILFERLVTVVKGAVNVSFVVHLRIVNGQKNNKKRYLPSN